MKFMSKFVALTLVCGMSQTALAGDSMIEHYNYDMIAQNVSKGFEPNNNSIQINGTDIYVSYTTWADTAGNSDDQVVRQNGLDYSSHWGLAMTNKDHGGKLDDWHTIDNNPDDWKYDFDMVLFSFSESVALTSTKFQYLTGAGNENQLTVVGFDNIDIFKNTANTATTWGDIAGSSAITSVTHKNISPNPAGRGNYEVTYPTLTEAKYWLVGAYNTHFDPSASLSDIDGSGFKLAALGFSQTTTKTTPPPKEVSAPNTLAFMGLGLGFVMFRRKRLG